jgi:hypothetical protein
MSTLKISKHSDMPTALDLVQEEVGKESRRIFSAGGDALKAENFMKFCQSDIVRFLFLMTDEALTTLAREVPWFHEWKTADGLLNFNDDVNKQLCTLFKLTKPESCYVTKTIRTLDISRDKSTRSSTQNTVSPSPSRGSSNP